MYPTMEVRWFLPGQIPTEVYQWFETCPVAPSQPETRQDWYLYQPESDTLGIKLRQGSLEIKKRMLDRGIHTLLAGVTGRVEKWVKWSFRVHESEQTLATLGAEGYWVGVQKTRQQRWYDVTDRQEVRPIAPNPQIKQEIKQGCTLEVTQVSIDNQLWFSLGLEAFGAADPEEILHRVAQQALAGTRFTFLTAERSFGYPCWLSQVVKR